MYRSLIFFLLGSLYIIVGCCSSAPASTAESKMSFERLRKIDSMSENIIVTSADAKAYVADAAEAWSLGASNGEDVQQHKFLSRLTRAEFNAAQNPDKKISDAQIAIAFNRVSAELKVSAPTLDDAKVRAFRIIWRSVCPHLFPANEKLRPVAASVLLYLLIYNGGVSEAAIQLSQSASLLQPDYVHGKLVAKTFPVSSDESKQMDYLNAVRSLSPQQVNQLVEIAAGQLGF
jgi:hypothetical protein